MTRSKEPLDIFEIYQFDLTKYYSKIGESMTFTTEIQIIT